MNPMNDNLKLIMQTLTKTEEIMEDFIEYFNNSAKKVYSRSRMMDTSLQIHFKFVELNMQSVAHKIELSEGEKDIMGKYEYECVAVGCSASIQGFSITGGFTDMLILHIYLHFVDKNYIVEE